MAISIAPAWRGHADAMRAVVPVFVVPSLVVAACVALAWLAAAPGAAAAGDGDGARWEWSGFAGFELRGFASSGVFDGQDDDVTASVVLEPELYRELDNGDALIARPFLRLDSADDERSRLDLRELYWQRVGDGWELDIGLRKVFWGVTESVHLVDIVNQTDAVEDPDGEDKLGQPMIRLGLTRPWGRLQLFVLPVFRERTFAGTDGRLRPRLPVDTDAARYESSAEESHVDVAVRYSRVVGAVDLGVSYFRGTSREPLLVVEDGGGTPTLVPLYLQIDQVGLDVQATLDAWLLKLEAIGRWSTTEDSAVPGFGDHTALAAGFEYTLFDLAGRGADLGLLAEYLWDERGDRATTPFADDLFVAARLALNDVQSSELLAGAIVDLDSGAVFVTVEGSRRLGDRFELELRLGTFSGAEPLDPLAAFEADDYLQLTLKRYF
ncbi:MAG: hypothetical protein AAGC60_17000 [Acidobacteriota bacterium]